MFSFLRSTIVITALAIFSTLFGAANLMYPLRAGLNSGSYLGFGMVGFIITAVCFPLLGLIGIILFNGDYRAFFSRLGKIPGDFMIGFCMAIIGPVFAMSRIVNICHGMLVPFLPDATSLSLFSIIFCLLTFIVTYRESKIIGFLANLVSPILIASLVFIIGKGIVNPQPLIELPTTGLKVFLEEAVLGYLHLDLLGTIFFGSIIFNLLKQGNAEKTPKALAIAGMKGGILGCFFLAVIYSGMMLLSAYHGHEFVSLPDSMIFGAISFKLLGHHGTFVIALTVAIACFSTLVALAAVLADYTQRSVFKNRISYPTALTIIVLLTMIISCSGLDCISTYLKPLINTIYPLLLTLSCVNIAYKLWNFSYVKMPVFITLLISLYINYPAFAVYGKLFC